MVQFREFDLSEDEGGHIFASCGVAGVASFLTLEAVAAHLDTAWSACPLSRNRSKGEPENEDGGRMTPEGVQEVESMPVTGDAAPEAAWMTPAPRFTKILKRPEIAVIVVAIIEFAYFSIASPYFLSMQVWGTILVIAAELGIVAVIGTLLLIAGDFDLSQGSVLGMTAAMIPFCLGHGIGIWESIGVALAVCVLVGLGNGFLVVGLGLPSLIVTIGGLMFYRGIALHLSGSENVSIDASTARALRPFSATYNSISVSVLWFAGIALAAIVLLGRTAFGNWIFATGGNRSSAITSGIPTARVRTFLFVCSALAAGFCGLLYTARLTSIDGLSGSGVELEVILAIVVGGTALHGGSGGVIGTVVGVLVLAMAKMGLILVGVPGYWYQAGIGLFLILTVAGNEVVRTQLANR
jgi:simple sugar transport system permease protein